MDSWEQILYNIVGGALVAILTWAFLKLVKKYYKWDFKRVFGDDSAESFFIVFAKLEHRPCFQEDGKPMDWPYYKPEKAGAYFKVSSVTSSAGMRSVKYLSGIFGEVMHVAPELISDVEKDNKLDISFCSLGGHNNLKTGDILSHDENRFFNLHSNKIVVKKEQGKIFSMQDGYDFGIIIKIIPKSFPNRVWIAVAGLGEWGTSGSAWFLSKNWKRLPKNKSFGLIVKTKIGQDESAEIIYNSCDTKR